MKIRFAITAVAALILSAPVAFAADDHRDEQHGNQQGPARPQAQARPQEQARPQNQIRPQGQPRSQGQARPETQARPQGQPRPQGQAKSQGQTARQTQVAPQAQPQNRASHAAATTPSHNAARGQGSSQTNGTRANVDVHAYQRNVNAQRQFHAGTYRAPQGYSYRRWSYGQSLPAVYFGRSFWINDYNSYDLTEPPYGFVWVRFGPDALLINEYTGTIVQVDYGVFY